MKPVNPFHRQTLAALAGMLLFFGLLQNARADAPQVKTQVPGYYRIMLGGFEITAIHDGNVGVDMKLLRNIPEQDIRSLLARMFVTPPQMPTSVNEFLINTGSKLVLVDTGGGNRLGPTLGNMLQNIRASGYDPDRIDVVLISHMHGDHIAGLLNPEGGPAFPKATVYVSKPENDFWLSGGRAEKASDAQQQFVKLARDAAAPYIAAGKWQTFENGSELFPSIKATVVPGHTPGHAVFEVASGGRSLLIIGDSIHSMAVQFARPDVAIDFDIDPEKAVAVRQALFKNLAEGKTLIAASHLPFPGIGHIRAEGTGAFAWVPVEFSPLQD